MDVRLGSNHRLLMPSATTIGSCSPPSSCKWSVTISAGTWTNFTSYPGSVHDSRVLRNIPIYTEQRYPPQGFFILGDGGYPCLSAPIALITPYKEPVLLATARWFNHHHAKARSIIERSFGSMKTRWRAVFFKALKVKPTFSPDVIACCAMLHNICLSNCDIVGPGGNVKAW